jgi:hypothetical protein
VVESVYSAVRTDSLYKADYVWSLEGLNKSHGFKQRAHSSLSHEVECNTETCSSNTIMYVINIHCAIVDFKLPPCSVCCMFFLGNSPASEFYMPTFRSTLFYLYKQVCVE